MSEQPDDAVLRMLAGAHFGPNARLTLPSGRVLESDEAQALTSAYAPAADRPSLDRQLADAAQDRTKLLAELARDAAQSGKPAKWHVVKQIHLGGEVTTVPACRHRFEWVAELCARRWTNRHASSDGAYFSARRADA